MDKNEEMREQILKWREERKKRLMARLFRNNPFAAASSSSPIASAILGIKSSRSGTGSVNSSQQKPCQPQTKNMYRKSIAPSQLDKERMIQLEKRHTLNAQTLIKIGRSIQNDFPQKKRETLGKESRVGIMKKYDENRKLMMRKTLSSIENTKLTSAGETESAKVQKVDELLDSNECKDVLDDCQAAKTKTDFGEELNSTFTLPSADEPLSPIECIDDLAMKSGMRRQSSTPLRASSPHDKDLGERLSTWLQNKGKSIDGFPHLKCFMNHQKKFSSPSRQPMKVINSSIPRKPVISNPKPINLPVIAIETIHEEQENSRGDLTMDIRSSEEYLSPMKSPSDAVAVNSKPTVQSPQKLSSENLNDMTIKALHELLTLIHTGYPWESCREWLMALRNRNPDADSLPDYWECLAALEEMQGDMQLAVDSYQRALMRGAEISHIDECLDSLFDKMSSLNLECVPYTPRQTSTKKKTCVDAKNIFKSSVIQFALMQQKVKNFSSENGVSSKNLNYIATPVRRSTRQSLFTTKTPQRCTPSLKHLRTEESENIQFIPNKALLFDD